MELTLTECQKFISKIILILLFAIYIYFLVNEFISKENLNTKSKVDYDFKVLDDCYLKLDTLISINFTNVSNYDSKINSYIYSSTKPFMIELLQNASNDCICCPNNHSTVNL